MSNELEVDVIPLSARDICRICSSPAKYEIYAPIPSYLHASPNDFLYWKKDINTLVENTTGLSIHPDDGLPKKMCALCISYLKHAVTFRQQAIDNTLSLKAAQAILEGRGGDRSSNGNIKIGHENQSEDKCGFDLTEDDLIFNSNRKTETNNIVNNVFNSSTTKNNAYMNKCLLLNNTSSKDQPNKSDENTNASHLNSYLNLLFDRKAERRKSGKSNINTTFFDHIDSVGEDVQTASSDDTDTIENNANFFSYKEKSFVEDDVMSLDFIKDANIIINIPENIRERKCPACFRRFMFENSYKDHMNSCLELKFLILIENLNRLSSFRKSRAISPHEFIRRMIFCLKVTCQYLTESCGEEMPMPDLSANSEAKASHQSKLNVQVDNTELDNDDKVSKTSECDPLLNLLREKADASFVRYMCVSPSRSSRRTGSIASHCHSSPSNNTKLDSTNSDSSIGTTEENITIRSNPAGRKSLLESFNQVANNFTSTPKLLSPTNLPFGLIKMNFSARCNACDTIFESIASLEEHNSKYHNNIKKLEDHKRIIAMFESDDNDTIGDSTVDVVSEACRDNSHTKMLKCSKCGKSCSTIMHHDKHKIKCISVKPPFKRSA